MPFQGNTNAGGIDPQIMSMLFQARKDRAALARQQMLDQATAALQAKDDARKDELHRFKVMMERAKLAGELGKMAGNVDSSRRNAEEVTSTNLTQDDLMSDGGGLDFASVVAQNDPTAANQVQESSAAQANFAQSLNQYGEVASALSPGIDPVSSALGAGQSVESGRAREAKLALDVDVADENRQEKRDIRGDTRAANIAEAQAQRNYRRTVAQFGEEITSLTDQISAQDKVLATEPPGSPKFQRAQVLRARLESGMAKRLTENVDPGHFDNVQKFMDDNVSLMQEGETVEKDLLAFKDLAERDSRFLGTTKGGLISFVSSLTEGASDIASTTNSPAGEAISDIALAARDALIRDETLSPSQRAKLQKDLGMTEDGVLQARTDARSLSNRVAYLVTRMQNPGRFANAQYEKNREAYALDTGSAKQALRNLTTAIAEIQSGNRRTRERLGVYQGLLPGISGGLTTPQGTSVFEPGQPTPFNSTSGQPNTTPVPPAANTPSTVDALEELMKRGQP